MEIDTHNEEREQDIQGEGGEGEYQSWQEQPTRGACSMQEDELGYEKLHLIRRHCTFMFSFRFNYFQASKLFRDCYPQVH
jgi:hypothetical protein